MKEYLKKKETDLLATNITQSKYGRSFKKVPQSFSEDGLVRFGYKVMLMNKKTKAYLSFDLGDKVTSLEEAYACTTNPKVDHPVARTMFILTRADNDDGYSGNEIHYG
jgi:hypothetical protein